MDLDARNNRDVAFSIMKNRGGANYLAPGMQGGGLFMQYISGIFIDE